MTAASCTRFVDELFDESKRDSAIGRMRTLLGSYFDGDASRLAQLLDPTRLGSPLHQFRTEISAGLRASSTSGSRRSRRRRAARGAERLESAAKGTDFEVLLEETARRDACRGSGDAVERTG